MCLVKYIHEYGCAYYGVRITANWPLYLRVAQSVMLYKRYPVKMSQNQNVPSDLPKRPIFGESKSPKYIFTTFNQTQDSKHFLSQSQNVPKSKCPKSKRPKVKMSQVKTSQSQNVPSQNVLESKYPRVKTSQVKMSQVKMSQVKTSQSQNVQSCLSACKQHYTVMNFFIS